MVGLVTPATVGARQTGGITESFIGGRKSALDIRNQRIQQALLQKQQLTEETKVGIAGRKQVLAEKTETRLAGEAQKKGQKLDLEINKLTDAQDARQLIDIARKVQLVDDPEQKRAFLQSIKPENEFTANIVSEALQELDQGDIEGFNQLVDGLLAFEQDVAQSPLGEIIADIKGGFIPLELGKLELAKRLSGSESEKQKTIKAFMNEFDLDSPTATALANGLIETTVNPVTGESAQTTKVPGLTVGETGLERTVQPGAAVTTTQPGAKPDITAGINVLEEFAGPADVAARFGEVVPFLSDIFTGEDEIQAKVIMDSLSVDIERAFAKNPRFAEGEVKRLQKLVPKGGIFSTLSASQNQLRGLKTALNSGLSDETATGSNDSLGAVTRRDARENANNISNLMNKIDQILAASQEFSPEDIAAEMKRRGL